LTEEKRLFPRSNSGLVRIIGPVTAVLIALVCAMGGWWQVWVFEPAGLGPLPENLWFGGLPPELMALVLGGLIYLTMMLGFSILTAAMPRSGGGYVTTSRILGSFVGFVGSWFEFLFMSAWVGILAAVILEHAFYNVGPALAMNGIAARPPYNDVGFTIGGALLIVIATMIVALGARITGVVLRALSVILAVSGCYVLGLLALAIINPAILQHGISAWAQGHGVAGVTPDTYVKAALAQGLDAANVGNYWTAVSVSLLSVYVFYLGFAATTFVAGEVKEPAKNFPKMTLLGPLVIMITALMVTALGTYAAAGVGQTVLANGNRWSFYGAYSYLSYAGTPSLKVGGLPEFHELYPNLVSMVAAGLGLSSLNVIILAFAMLLIFGELPVVVLIGSRMIFAMSFDGMLPRSLSKVNGRFHSPIYAVVLMGVLAIAIGVGAQTCVFCNGGSWRFSGPVGDAFNIAFTDGFYFVELWDVIFFTLFSLAVVLFPFRLKRVYDQASFKPGGKIGVVGIGLAGIVGNLIVAWVILTTPYFAYTLLSPTPDTWYILEFTALTGIIGALIYAYYRFGPSRKVIDYSAIFSEIPPE
jgi:basic amino acid/polyamine antiporter, APA family